MTQQQVSKVDQSSGLISVRLSDGRLAALHKHQVCVYCQHTHTYRSLSLALLLAAHHSHPTDESPILFFLFDRIFDHVNHHHQMADFASTSEALFAYSANTNTSNTSTDGGNGNGSSGGGGYPVGTKIEKALVLSVAKRIVNISLKPLLLAATTTTTTTTTTAAGGR